MYFLVKFRLRVACVEYAVRHIISIRGTINVTSSYQLQTTNAHAKLFYDTVVCKIVVHHLGCRFWMHCEH